MANDLEELHKIRVEISQGIFETRILFQKIYEYEENAEIITLAGIGKKICQDGRNNCEKLELAINGIKNRL